jgi:hypothetical protein
VLQRIHSAAEFEGTGVWLSIVQRVIVRRGGRIWAEATVNQGATFFFIVPGRSRAAWMAAKVFLCLQALIPKTIRAVDAWAWFQSI